MENGSDRASNKPFDDDPQNGVAEAKAAMEAVVQAAVCALADAVEGAIGTMVDLRDTLNKPWANSDSIGNTEKADSNTSTMDKLKSVGYAILAGGGKFSTGCREAIDWAGEHIGGLDFDRPDPQTGKTYRDEIEEVRKRDEESYNDLREKAPCKELFDKVSNVSETTLNVGSLVMGAYGAKQVVKSGINYLKTNEPYIKAMSSEFKNDAAMLKQAVKNVKNKSSGITF